MAVALGTNAGFVSAAPSADPSGTDANIDTIAFVQKTTSPAGANSVTSMGWWCDNATEEADFDVGLYSHDAVNDYANVLLASAANQAKGTTAGWKTASVAYDLSESTTYWVAAQLDDTATATTTNRSTTTDRFGYRGASNALPNPFGSGSGYADTRTYAIYALYEAAAGGLALPVIDYHYNHMRAA